MWIVTKYTIGFSYPQDYEAERKFKESNNIDGWVCHASTLASSYTKESIYDLGSRVDAQAVVEENLPSPNNFCKSQLITCSRVNECNGVCPFEEALKKSEVKE